MKAVRIGKQYRISGQDLAALTGRSVESLRPQPVRRERHIEVSSIVEIDAVRPETANRLTTSLMGAASGVRVESIYYAERGCMKIIVVGSMEQNAAYFKMIATLLGSES